MTPAPIRASHLRCEYQTNPLGLHEPSPRVFWWVDDPRPAACQTAYRIRCASSPDRLQAAKLWDSGKVISGQQAHIPLGLSTLTSRQRVYWDVTLWGLDGAPGLPSDAAWFETGLLNPADWAGQFITTDLFGSGRTSPAVPLLRRTFNLPAGIARARLYITALGLYDAQINGNPITADCLRPGWTDYHHRLAYQTYDVAHLLTNGANAIGVMLGDGWYCGRVAHLDRGLIYGQQPALLAQLEVDCQDGTRHTIATDSTWQWSTGPIDSSDLLAGEEYDARKEVSGWSSACCSSAADGRWRPTKIIDRPAATLMASAAPPARIVQELSPVAEPAALQYEWGRRHHIFDFGQNFAGNIRLHVCGPRGCTLQLRFAEVLSPNGRLDTSNLRAARVTDTYTLRGDPAGETWTHRFTFHGFRYAEISYHESFQTPTPDRPALAPFDRSTLTGLVLMTDTPLTGTFHTDHPLLNQLQSNIVWGQRSNFLEVPTDCPQRDERLGWTGDAQVFAPTAAFNMDVAGFFTKWMLDLDDAQTPDGDIPEVAPALFVTRDAGPGWSDARVVIPLAMYHAYADKRLLERHYPSMRRWIQHHIRTSQNGTRCFPDTHTWQGFGDWLALDGNSLNPLKNATPRELIATAYFAYALDVIRQIADILGHTADARLFAETRRQAADAFCHHFFTPTGRSTAPSQTSYLMALAFDLLPEDLRPSALAHLVELIHERDDHLSTGFLGTPLLCPVLTRFGRVDLAYKLLLQTTYPSWLYPITLGATTMWERWNSWHPDKGFVDTTMNSLNHYAYGAVGEWMYATIAGLQPLAPGYQHVLIAPKPGGGLRHAAATLDTLHGKISVSWQIDDTGFHLTTTLPANTTAQAILPDGTQHPLAAGQHKLSCPFCLT